MIFIRGSLIISYLLESKGKHPHFDIFFDHISLLDFFGPDLKLILALPPSLHELHSFLEFFDHSLYAVEICPQCFEPELPLLSLLEGVHQRENGVIAVVAGQVIDSFFMIVFLGFIHNV